MEPQASLSWRFMVIPTVFQTSKRQSGITVSAYTLVIGAHKVMSAVWSRHSPCKTFAGTQLYKGEALLLAPTNKS